MGMLGERGGEGRKMVGHGASQRRPGKEKVRGGGYPEKRKVVLLPSPSPLPQTCPSGINTENLGGFGRGKTIPVRPRQDGATADETTMKPVHHECGCLVKTKRKAIEKSR